MPLWIGFSASSFTGRRSFRSSSPFHHPLREEKFETGGISSFLFPGNRGWLVLLPSSSSSSRLSCAHKVGGGGGGLEGPRPRGGAQSLPRQRTSCSCTTAACSEARTSSSSRVGGGDDLSSQFCTETTCQTPTSSPRRAKKKAKKLRDSIRVFPFPQHTFLTAFRYWD